MEISQRFKNDSETQEKRLQGVKTQHIPHGARSRIPPEACTLYLQQSIFWKPITILHHRSMLEQSLLIVVNDIIFTLRT